MRYWIKILSSLLITLLPFASCDRQGRSLPRGIENLIWENPDSALVILKSIEPQRLLTDEERALYGVLLTQCKYRCFEDFDNDSLINRSENYFAGTNWVNDSRDKHHFALALLYHGAVLEDLDSLPQAVRYYRNSLEVASDDDYPILAQASLRLAVIHYEHTANQEMTLYYLTRAKDSYSQLGDTAHLSATLGYIGSIYRVTDHSRAHDTLLQAANLALAQGDSAEYAEDLNMLARCYYYDSLYRQTITLCKSIEPLASGRLKTELGINLALAYSQLGMTDSAQHYMPPKESLTSQSQKVSLLEYEIIAAQRQQDYKRALELVRQQRQVNDNFINSSRSRQLVNADLYSSAKALSRSRHDAQEKSRKARLWHSLLLALAVLAGMVIAAMWWKRRQENKKWQQIIEQISQSQSLRGENYISDSHSEGEKDKMFDDVCDRYILSLKVLTHIAVSSNVDKKALGGINQIINLDNESIEETENLINFVVNKRYDNYASDMRNRFEELTTKEYLYFEFSKLGFSSKQIAILLGYKNSGSVRKLKQRIMAKATKKQLN